MRATTLKFTRLTWSLCPRLNVLRYASWFHRKDLQSSSVDELLHNSTRDQAAGLKFLYNREQKANSGGLFCDGIGRLTQFIALVSQVKPSDEAKVKTTLVVCPLSLLHRWTRKFKEQSPQLSAFIYQGPKRLKDAKKLEELGQPDVILTTYETVLFDYFAHNRKVFPIKSILYNMTFFRIIADEAHHFRNPQAKLYNAILNIPSEDRRWAVTDSPVNNDVCDLQSLINFITANIHPTSFRELIYRREQKPDGLPPCRYNRKTIQFTSSEESIQRDLIDIFRKPIHAGTKKFKSVGTFIRFLRLRQFCNEFFLLPAGYLKAIKKQDKLDEGDLEKIVSVLGEGQTQKTLYLRVPNCGL